MMRFPGIGFGDNVPSAKIIWLIRQQPAKTVKPVANFDKHPSKVGYPAMAAIVAGTMLHKKDFLNDEDDRSGTHPWRRYRP